MKILSRQEKIFTELYSKYYALMYNTIYLKTSNHETAGDLAQEVFSRFYEKIDNIEKPRQWLFGTMRFVILEYYRRNTKDERDLDDYLVDKNISSGSDHIDTTIVFKEAIENNSNYKNEQERILFELIALYNYSFKEAASQVGMTIRQARYRYDTVVERIILDLQTKGISNLDDLL